MLLTAHENLNAAVDFVASTKRCGVRCALARLCKFGFTFSLGVNEFRGKSGLREQGCN